MTQILTWGFACLAPLRKSDEGLEVFYIRRNLWDHEQDKPMPWPAEWVPAGGKKEPGETPVECAIREFKEETEYTGNFKKPCIARFDYLSSGKRSFNGYYLIAEPESTLVEHVYNDNIMDSRWLNVSKCKNYFQSKEYDRAQKDFLTVERQPATNAVKLLKWLDNPDNLRRVGYGHLI